MKQFQLKTIAKRSAILVARQLEWQMKAQNLTKAFVVNIKPINAPESMTITTLFATRRQAENMMTTLYSDDTMHDFVFRITEAILGENTIEFERAF